MQAKYRYPGTKPFSTDEQSIFFGRDKDIANLHTSVVVNPTSVLFGKSGTGKTSIIQAGLIPKLQTTKSDGEDSPPWFLIGIMPKPYDGKKNLLQEIKNIVAKNLENEINFLKMEGSQTSWSLWYLLKTFQYRQLLEKKQQTILLLFDQAEEIFTYPESQIDEFVEQLYPVIGQFLPETVQKLINEKFSQLPSEIIKVLYSPLPVKFLFSLRSDKLHLITRLKKASPQILQNSYELLSLTQEQAYQAIDEPAGADGDFASKKFEIAREAKEHIFKELVANQNISEGNFDKKRIDSFSLQIICSNIEQKVISTGVETVELTELENPQKIINGYYKNCINSLDVTEVEKENVRNLIESLLLSNGHRIPIHEDFITGEKSANPISIKALNELINLKLLKKDFNISGQGWMYEITHDSFIKPILEARAERLGTTLDYKANETIRLLQLKIKEKERKNLPEESQEEISSAINAKTQKKKLSKTDINVSKSTVTDFELFDLYKKLGDAYYVIKDYKSAIIYFTKALKVPYQNNNSFFIEVYKARSNSYFYLNEFEDSNNDLQKILYLDPNDHAAMIYLVDNYDKQNKLDEASTLLSTDVSLIDFAADLYNEIGNRYYQRADYAKAKSNYLQALKAKTSKNQNEIYRNLGLVEEMTGQIDSALNYYKKSLECKVSAHIYNDIGNVYFSEKDYDKAKVNYNIAIATDPNFYIAIYNLGLIEEAMENWDAAIENYKKVIELDAGYTDALLRVGIIYFDIKRDYNKARELYARLIEINPQKEYYYDAGQIEAAMANWDAAIENYKKAIELDSNYANALLMLGATYFDKKDYLKAKETYVKLIEINPQKENYYDAGQIEEAMENWDAAIENYKKAIELDTKYKDALLMLGIIYFDKKKDYFKAKEIYARLIEIDPQKEDYYNAGQIEEAMENWDAAIENYKKAIKLDSKYANALLRLGAIYFDKKDYPTAKEMYARLIEIDAQKEYYYDAAQIEEVLENWDDAIDNYKKAIELDSEYADAILSLAAIYNDKTEYKNAIKFYTKYLEVASDDNVKIYNVSNELGLLYSKINEKKTALRYFKKAIELEPTDYHLLPLTKISILLNELNRKQESSLEFDKILEIWHTKDIIPYSLNQTAWELYLANFHLDTAEKMARKAHHEEPESENTLQTFAALLIRQDKWAESIDYIGKWLRLVTEKRLIAAWQDFVLMFKDVVKYNHQEEMVEILSIKKPENEWQLLAWAFLKSINKESSIKLPKEKMYQGEAVFRQLAGIDPIGPFPYN